MNFNVLRDPWIPLDVGSAMKLATYGDLLSGKADAPELRHPRDDFRFFARMLLSAITQALLPPRDVVELRARMADPLAQAEVEAVISAAAADFEFLGTFLQTRVGDDAQNETSRLLLDAPSGSNHLLFRHRRNYSALCPSCTVTGVYGAQAFAPLGGRGKSPGVRGAPPLTTLVWRRSVRETTWANTLALDEARELYPDDGPHAWRSMKRVKPGDRIGLLEGLFWTPRGLEVRPVTGGACDVCGARGDRLAIFGFEARSKVNGGFFRHPHTPAVQDLNPRAKRSWRPCYLRAERPAWTGLAEMLSVVAPAPSSVQRRIAHAAPVVRQWIERLENREITLQLLSYVTDKAKVTGRFIETYTLSMQDGATPLVDLVRFLLDRAERGVSLLVRALRRAHSSRAGDPGGYALEDAVSNFWRDTESEFWDTLEVSRSGEDGTGAFLQALRERAARLFDQHTEMSFLDNGKQALIARARARLRRDLAKEVGVES